MLIGQSRRSLLYGCLCAAALFLLMLLVLVPLAPAASAQTALKAPLQQSQPPAGQVSSVDWFTKSLCLCLGIALALALIFIILRHQQRQKISELRKELEECRRIEDIVSLRLNLLGFAESHSLDELLQKTLDEVGHLTGSPIGFYHFVDMDNQTLIRQAWSTRTLEEFCSVKGKGRHFRLDQAGVWADCVHARKPVIHNDYKSLPHRRGMPKGHARVVRELVVPIIREDQVVAILGVGNKSGDYTQEDVQIVSYVADVAWEITHRKQAEQAASDSERKFRETVMNLDEGYYCATLEGIILEHNPAFNRMLDIDPAKDLRGRRMLDFWQNPSERELCVKKLETDGAVHNHEVEIKTARGERRVVILNSRLESSAADAAPCISGTIIDFTERKFAEESLKAFSARQEVLLSALPDIIMELNADKVYTWANKAGIEFFGPDVIGNKAGYYFEGEQDACDIVAPLLRGDQDMVHLQSWQRRRDGKKRLLAWRCRSLKDDQGQVVGVLSTARDITEIQLLRDQFQQAQKMESVGRLAGGVAHDFNNMLGVIIGRSEIAMEKAGPGHALYDELLEVRTAALRSADLTRQLLAFARKQTISPRVLDLNDTVASTLKMLRRLIGEDIELVWKPGLDIWPIKMDPIQIDQVLANLCVNSRDAIAGVGTLTIKTENVFLEEHGDDESLVDLSSGPYVSLTVSDNGCGIEEESIGHVFEPFYTSKEVGVGTGLGLATVYGIVKQNNGYIDVQSAPGQGTTIRILLPRGPEQPQPGNREDANEPKFGSETVLLVEDETATLNLGQAILERFGYQVLAADCPNQALALAEQNKGKIDLVITDVVMPKMNGKQLVEKLAAGGIALKAIFMSGYTSEAVARHGVLEEGVNFIQKPFTVLDLTTKVREVLDSK